MVVSHSIGSPDHGNFKRHIALRLSRAPLIRYESVLSLFAITLPFLFGCWENLSISLIFSRQPNRVLDSINLCFTIFFSIQISIL